MERNFPPCGCPAVASGELAFLVRTYTLTGVLVNGTDCRYESSGGRRGRRRKMPHAFLASREYIPQGSKGIPLTGREAELDKGYAAAHATLAPSLDG